MHDFKSISDIFNKEDTFANLRNSIQQVDVVSKFEAIFPDLKKIASAVKMEKKILYIRVENSVWRSELKFKQKLVIDKINKHYNQEVIRAVKFLS